MHTQSPFSLCARGALAAILLVGAAGFMPGRAAHGARDTAAAPVTQDVPMYRGSATGNPLFTTGQNLTLTWTSPFLKSIAVDAIPYSDHLYVGGMVTTPQYTRFYGGSEFHDPFYALDLRTGKIAWQVETPNWHTRGPAVVNGTIYLGVGNSWAQSTWPVDWDTVVRGTGPSGVYAYDAATGSLKWSFSTPGAVHNTPLYHDGVVYAVTGDRAVYAIDAQTGKLLWKLPIPSYDSVSSPILQGNLIYFGGAHPYRMYAVNIDTHSIAWQTDLPNVTGATDDCTPAVANGLVYIEGVTSSKYKVLPTTGTPVGQSLFALDASTGKIVWTYDEGQGHTPFFYAASTPIVVGDTVYFGSDVTASFYAVNAATGVERWHFSANSWSIPAMIGESGTLAQGIVWTATFGGRLLGLRASDGTLVVDKQLAKTGIYAGTPVVVDNTLILASQAGKVIALSIPQLLGKQAGS
jgi:outer membrane protein assembly factor BamB